MVENDDERARIELATARIRERTSRIEDRSTRTELRILQLKYFGVALGVVFAVVTFAFRV